MFWTDASTRDKAPWRKSAINAPESDDSSRRLRRMRSRVQTDDSAANEPAKPVEATTTIDRKNSVDKDRELRKAIIGSLGRQPAEDKLTIYIKQDSDTPKEVPATVVVPPSPVMRRKFNSSNLDADKKFHQFQHGR